MHVLWYLDTIKRWFQDTTLLFQINLEWRQQTCKIRIPIVLKNLEIEDKKTTDV